MWRAAGQVGFPYGSAAQLLILTGARREEIGQLKWSEIEDDAIHLDGERTKNGNPHIIPLSSVAQALLAGLPRISEFVFSFGTRAINSWARMKNKIDGLAQIEPWRIMTYDGRSRPDCRSRALSSKSPRRFSVIRLAHAQEWLASTRDMTTPTRSEPRWRLGALTSRTSSRAGNRARWLLCEGKSAFAPLQIVDSDTQACITHSNQRIHNLPGHGMWPLRRQPGTASTRRRDETSSTTNRGLQPPFSEGSNSCPKTRFSIPTP